MATNDKAETTRLEAFSDGVFAIAITLLILEIKVPYDLKGMPLTEALVAQWPSFAGFITSFLLILVMWLNHHRIFQMVHKVDDRLLATNGFLLLVITFIPFPTAVLAENLLTANARTSAIFYCSTFWVMTLAFNLLWWAAISNNSLINRERDGHRIDHITRQFRLGPLLYGVLLALAFVNVPLCLIANFALALFFAIPQRATA